MWGIKFQVVFLSILPPHSVFSRSCTSVSPQTKLLSEHMLLLRPKQAQVSCTHVPIAVRFCPVLKADGAPWIWSLLLGDYYSTYVWSGAQVGAAYYFCSNVRTQQPCMTAPTREFSQASSPTPNLSHGHLPVGDPLKRASEWFKILLICRPSNQFKTVMIVHTWLLRTHWIFRCLFLMYFYDSHLLLLWSAKVETASVSPLLSEWLITLWNPAHLLSCNLSVSHGFQTWFCMLSRFTPLLGWEWLFLADFHILS